MKRLFPLHVLLVAVVLLADSLAVAVGAETGNFAGLVDISGGRKMYLKCNGKGSPTVMLVGGLRASADDWDISDKSKPTVFTEVGKFTRVCVRTIGLGLQLVKSQAAATPSRSRTVC